LAAGAGVGVDSDGGAGVEGVLDVATGWDGVAGMAVGDNLLIRFASRRKRAASTRWSVLD
jgi:hypothetical protein